MVACDLGATAADVVRGGLAGLAAFFEISLADSSNMSRHGQRELCRATTTTMQPRSKTFVCGAGQGCA